MTDDPQADDADSAGHERSSRHLLQSVEARVLPWLADRLRRWVVPDHLTLLGVVASLAIGLGLGLSPYMLLSVGLAIVVAYLLLSINVYLETYVYEEFSFAYGWLGPTEARVALIGLNTVAVTAAPLSFAARGVGATIFDVAGAVVALGMLGLLAVRVAGNLRRLARLEPPPEP